MIALNGKWLLNDKIDQQTKMMECHQSYTHTHRKYDTKPLLMLKLQGKTKNVYDKQLLCGLRFDRK